MKICGKAAKQFQTGQHAHLIFLKESDLSISFTDTFSRAVPVLNVYVEPD